MLFNEVKHEFEIEGRKASFEIGKLARKSEVAVLGRMGETVILVTVNTSEAPEDAEYFPLSVEYLEKLYAAGMISSSRFVKRERYPSDEAVLKARIIDRSFRPRFPSDYRNEVQVIVKVLSYDPENDPLVLSLNTVSAALHISEAPFDGPISGVRVGLKDNQLMPYYKDLDIIPNVDLTLTNLVTAGDGEKLVNIDADMFEVPEEKALEGLKYSLELMKPWIEEQKKFAEKYVESRGEIQKHEYTSFAVPTELVAKIKEEYGDNIKEELSQGIAPDRSSTLEEIYTAEGYEGEYTKSVIREAFEKACKYYTRKHVWEKDERIDGRAFDELRELNCETGLMPKTHGTGLFTRGMTQILSIATLDTLKNKQLIEDMTGEETRRYIHYYEDAPSSYGSVGRLRYNPSRRAVGHGALGEKALIPVLPDSEDFPYMMLVISEIMSENGSSSMGSISGSSLALMDAGVPLKAPVAGIAMGIVIAEEDDGELDLSDYRVLTDMQALEDFYGFMDFKVAGTKDGITAIQFDTKSKGLTIDIFEKGFEMALKARMEILECMNGVIAKPKELSENAPRVYKMNIPQDKIGELIGPGGKNIRELTEKTGTEINVEEDGEVMIYGQKKDAIEAATKDIKQMFFVPIEGKVYEGEVVRIENYGAFVDLAPGKAGLLHVSNISEGEYIEDVRDHLSVGDKVKVKVMNVDQEGKVQLKKVE